MIHVTCSIAIDESEIQECFVRASGPGGQNVNKVATAVQIRFNAANSSSLPEEVRSRLISLAGKRITQDGTIVIDARKFRTQARNREDAISRLVELIRNATQRPKYRSKTRPTLASNIRRLENKHRVARNKHLRGRIYPDNE
ncbi:alternative ribosome rescue aminoacyl-tRNA hydrolase ArfB [Chloroflexota bacterium]